MYRVAKGDFFLRAHTKLTGTVFSRTDRIARVAIYPQVYARAALKCLVVGGHDEELRSRIDSRGGMLGVRR